MSLWYIYISASEISLTNTAPSEMTWNLSSVAPAYVKVCVWSFQHCTLCINLRETTKECPLGLLYWQAELS